MLGNILILLKFSVSWVLLPLVFLLLFMDGLVYTLVAVAYKVFQLMSQLNFNTLGSLFSALTTRVRAIIAVLILFIIGYSLIQYLVNPDKAQDKNKAGGVAILKNIAISSILLISYGTIFGIINEFSLLLVGTPGTYNYVYLSYFGVEGKEADEGAIMRFINGGTGSYDDETENIDFGKKLAVTTLSSFLHGMESQGLYSKSEGYDKSIIGQIFNDALKEDDFNIIFSLPSAASSVWLDVYYFPLLSTALGAYIIYMLVTVSIQLGIRMFKLLVLQLIAPIAIITIMKDGFGSNIWKKYIGVLGKTYTDAFIRIGAMYFSFSFITLAYNNIGRIFDSAPGMSDLTTLLVYGVIVVAVLKLGKEIPSMIDSIFGSKLAENNKTGLSQFLGAAGGYALGSVSGAISGAATRFRNSRNNGDSFGKSLLKGAAGASSGAITGGFAGGAGGFKAKGGNIAEVFKNASSQGWKAGAPGIAGYVSGAAEAMGIGEGRIGTEQQVLTNLKKSKQYAVDSARNEGYTKFTVDGVTGADGKAIEFKADITGSKADAIRKVQSSAAYQNIQRNLENARNSSPESVKTSSKYQSIQSQLENIRNYSPSQLQADYDSKQQELDKLSQKGALSADEVKKVQTLQSEMKDLSAIRDGSKARELQGELDSMYEAAEQRKQDEINTYTRQLEEMTSKAGSTYDSAVRQALESSEAYKTDVKAAEKYFDKEHDSYFSKSSDSIKDLEIELAHREELRQRRKGTIGGGGKK